MKIFDASKATSFITLLDFGFHFFVSLVKTGLMLYTRSISTLLQVAKSTAIENFCNSSSLLPVPAMWVRLFSWAFVCEGRRQILQCRQLAQSLYQYCHELIQRFFFVAVHLICFNVDHNVQAVVVTTCEKVEIDLIFEAGLYFVKLSDVAFQFFQEARD